MHETMRRLVLTILIVYLTDPLNAQQLAAPDTVTIHSGQYQLKGLLWHPAQGSHWPAIIFCHGSYETTDTLDDLIQDVSLLGSVFARQGYLFLGVFRRGAGLSKTQGANTADLMAQAFSNRGQEGRNEIQIYQLQSADSNDIVSALSFLRLRKDVDTSRIGLVGHSYGGSLALLVASHDAGVKTVIVFSPAGYSWDRSSKLRYALIDAVRHIEAPIMIIHAQNDYSLHPGQALDSVLSAMNKPHLLKIYPPSGSSPKQGHGMIFFNPTSWEADVFKFLQKWLLK